MLQEPIHFQSIRIPVPMRSIYARLGFRKGVTALKQKERERVDRTIEEASAIVHLKGARRMVGLIDMDEAGIELEDGVVFSSSSLARMLSGCSHVLLMGSTAGPAIMGEILEASRIDDLTRAVVLDAVASEMSDAALDWMVSYTNQELMRGSRRLTKARFSAGYSDFALENQKAMYDLLRMDIIGVSITKTYILVPEKSVTAVAGVAQLGHTIIKDDERGSK